MRPSLVYRSPRLYDAFIRVVYGRHYAARYRAISDEIRPGSRVLDLCCGPAVLYRRYLRARDVRYYGLDLNPRFIADVVRQGGAGEVWNLREDRPLPAADYVVMQGGLLYFLPDPAPIVERMLAAATDRVIVAEAIRNLASSRSPLVAWIARRSTDAGTGCTAVRFTEKTLDAFFAAYAARVERRFLIPGGREKVYVLTGGAVRS
jgi:SAM-dependent methyltransferase